MPLQKDLRRLLPLLSITLPPLVRTKVVHMHIPVLLLAQAHVSDVHVRGRGGDVRRDVEAGAAVGGADADPDELDERGVVREGGEEVGEEREREAALPDDKDGDAPGGGGGAGWGARRGCAGRSSSSGRRVAGRCWRRLVGHGGCVVVGHVRV
jgi:hypothetical protein